MLHDVEYEDNDYDDGNNYDYYDSEKEDAFDSFITGLDAYIERENKILEYHDRQLKKYMVTFVI